MDKGRFLTQATIPQIQALYQKKQLTSEELVWMYLERIARLDRNGPCLNTILEINPDALSIAAALDRERETSGVRGPLHGIPILLKDNIDTADKMHTSAGSIALANSYAAEDAFLVKKLRQQGAILLGKTNMTEWANFMSTQMPNGYSSRGGQVLNPYGPTIFDVGGSSSGSGAAIAAHFATAAIGTETSGSILNPASRNAIVGIKPTLGLISRTGLIPLAPSQDTAGPMAATVADAAIVLGAMTGADSQDPITLTSHARAYRDYTLFLDRKGLKGARIGIPRGFFTEKITTQQQILFDKAITHMKNLGTMIVDNIQLIESEWKSQVLRYEFKSAINAYLSRLAPHVPVHSLAEVIDFNQQQAPQALKYGQDLLIAAEETSGSLTESEYIHHRKEDLLRSRAQGIDAVMEEHRLDALLFINCNGSDIAAKAGYPSITVPAGFTSQGEAVGITFMAQSFQEPTLIRLAYAFEQATKHRVPPTVLE